MSEFDEQWEEENYMNVSADRTEAEDTYNIGQQSQQAKIDELQGRVDVYELHIKTLKHIHENDFNEESESSYILGNLDGFFECIETDLKGNKDGKI